MRTGKESRLNRHLEGEGHTAVGNAHLNEELCPTPRENQCEPIQYVLSPTQEHKATLKVLRNDFLSLGIVNLVEKTGHTQPGTQNTVM